MTDSDTLLAYLLPSYTNLLEDAATDALAFILSKSEACRAALIDLLQCDDFQLEALARFATQETFGVSRPDMVGYDGEGKKRLMVESKFWAVVQPDQAGRYLRLLDDSEPGVLLFICPESRSSDLWSEVRAQLKRSEEPVDLDEIETDNGVRRAKVAKTDHHLILASWSLLLKKLDDAEEDPSIKSDIRQLRGLTRRQNEGTYQLPASGAEAPDFDVRHAYYRKLIGDAVQRGSQEDWLSLEGFTWGNSPRYYSRRYLWVAKAKPVWLGLGVEYRKDMFERTPIWVAIPERFWPNDEGDEGMIKTQDYWHLPIHLKASDVYEEVLNGLVSQVRTIADRFVAFKQAEGPDGSPD